MNASGSDQLVQRLWLKPFGSLRCNARVHHRL